MPSGIALHDRLEAIDLRNNRLDTIPPEWTNAPTTLVAQAPLVYLRIAGNQFTVRIVRFWHPGRVPLLLHYFLTNEQHQVCNRRAPSALLVVTIT